MADVGTYGHGSWARAGVDVVEANGDQLGNAREREHGERVMVVYRSGIALPGSVGKPSLVDWGPGMELVAVDPPMSALGWWPLVMLRTMVHEQCVPAALVDGGQS